MKISKQYTMADPSNFDGPFLYYDPSGEYEFIVMSISAFLDVNKVPLKYRKTLSIKTKRWCAEIDENYIQSVLKDSANGFIGFLTNSATLQELGVIMFSDMRPNESQLIIHFLCGRGAGKIILDFFNKHVVEHGKKLRAEGRVTVSLDALNVDKLLDFYKKMGYTEDDAEHDDHAGVIKMSKSIIIPPSGGGRTRRKFKMPRLMSKTYCKKTPCRRMGFTQRSSCRPYKNCFNGGSRSRRA